MAADLVIFDPDTVQPVTEDVVHDFPNKRLAHAGAGPGDSITPW